MGNVLGSIRKTIQEKDLFQPGDRIAVGLSGGKDSIALLHALSRFRKFSPIPFELMALTVDMGFDNFDLIEAKKLCQTLDVPYEIISTDIAKIVFEIREEKNPCALCANMRRGALAQKMNELNYNVLALGHHSDDAVSTFFLNMLYAGKLNTLEYKSYLSRANITVVRPLLDTSESDVIGYIKENDLPILKSPCPMDRQTKREEINTLLKSIYKEIPNSRKNVITAIRNEDQCNLFVNCSQNNKEPLK